MLYFYLKTGNKSTREEFFTQVVTVPALLLKSYSHLKGLWDEVCKTQMFGGDINLVSSIS